MRYIGALLLGIAAAAAGLYAGYNVRRRVELLGQCVSLVQFFAAGIGYGDEPIEALVDKAAKSRELRGLVFLSDAVGKRGMGDFSQRWAECIDCSFSKMALTSSDAELLKAFGSRLGTTDVQRQLELCELYKQRFSDCLAAAESSLQERARLFTIGGAAVGALLFVLFL